MQSLLDVISAKNIDNAIAIDKMSNDVILNLKSCNARYLCNIKRNVEMKWLPYLNKLKVVSRQATLNWMGNGCTNFGPYWENYIINKRNYKHAVRECKRNHKAACVARMLDSLSRHDNDEFLRSFN